MLRQNLATSSSASPSIASGETRPFRGTPIKFVGQVSRRPALKVSGLLQLRGLIIQMAIDLKIKTVRISIEVVRV